MSGEIGKPTDLSHEDEGRNGGVSVSYRNKGALELLGFVLRNSVPAAIALLGIEAGLLREDLRDTCRALANGQSATKTLRDIRLKSGYVVRSAKPFYAGRSVDDVANECGGMLNRALDKEVVSQGILHTHRDGLPVPDDLLVSATKRPQTSQDK